MTMGEKFRERVAAGGGLPPRPPLPWLGHADDFWEWERDHYARCRVHGIMRCTICVEVSDGDDDEG